MNNVFASLMGSFTNVLDSFATQLSTSLSQTLKLQFVFPGIVSILIIIWAIKKFKEGNALEIKTIISVCLFLAYVAFSAWALNKPKDFMGYFNDYMKLPSEILSDGITKGIQATGKLTEIQGDSGIDSLVNAEFNIIDYMSKIVWANFSIWKIDSTIIQVILGTIAMLIQLIYIVLICIIIVMTTIQYYMWSALAIFFVGLMFLPQTKGMVVAYVKLLISLTLYKPLVLAMSAINLASVNALIKSLPTTLEMNEKIYTLTIDGAKNTINIIGIFALICVVGILFITLTSQIPKIIDSILGTQSDISGVGNVSNMASKGTQAIGSMLGGAVAGSAMGLMKQAFSQGGGGLKGAGNALLAGLTGGSSVAVAPLAKKAGSLISKGISFGNSKIKGGKK